MEEIIKRCKCGIYLEVNRHRDSYDTIEKAIEEENQLSSSRLWIDPELSDRMIKENMLISLQFYPDTPIGFFRVYGTSLEEVVNKAKDILALN